MSETLESMGFFLYQLLLFAWSENRKVLDLINWKTLE